jgi:hypothetical protein
MKTKTKAKPTTRPRKPSERWPRFFSNMLAQLDVAGDDPVFLTKADIASDAKPYLSGFMNQGLLSEEFTNALACISCDAMAAILRTGAKGEKVSALCPCCGAVFQPSGKELRRWRADWNSLGEWIKVIAAINGEMEAVSPSALFLGHAAKGQERFEIYLARSLADQMTARTIYSAISQSMNGRGIVLSVAGNPAKIANLKMTIASLDECIVLTDAGGGFAWPEHVFAGKDQAKQRAGFAKVQNDPCQKQKENLKGFVRQKITGIFADKYHHKIAEEIIKKHAGQIAYTDRLGKKQQLSKRLILDAVAEIMRENGLDDWISGKKFRK